MYFAAAITSIAIGMTLLASMVRAVEVYPDAPEVTVRQVVAPPEVVLLTIATAEPDTPRVEATPEPQPDPSPVLMALVASTPAPTPIAAARTAAVAVATPVARAIQPPSLSGRVQAIYDALARSSWPEWSWDKVVAIAACESTYDPGAVGDSGRALGLLQLRSDAHPDLVARFNVMTIDGNLAAAWLVYLRKGEALGLPAGQGSFSPWSCA